MDKHVDIKGADLAAEARHALAQLRKKSRLRQHYLTLVEANNLFRAFIVLYTLEPEFRQAQEKLLKVLCDMEGRRDRSLFLPEFTIIEESLKAYTQIIESATDLEINEMQAYLAAQAGHEKYVITKHK